MNKHFSNAPPAIFGDENYIHYIVEYQGDIVADAKNSSTMYITVINNKYAIISMPLKDPNDRFTLENNPFPSIVYISRYYGYTLQSLSPIVAANINLTQIEPPFFLTGKGVIVGIIDTGVDYLNKEFMNADGTSRILNIWDQTINTPDLSDGVPFGSIYTNQRINTAIKAFNSGQNPYEIVPSKDEIGHGTAMTGIIGATGVDPELKGAAPDCEFVMVKLIEAVAVKKYLTPTVPIFDRTAIMLAIDYLYEYAIKVNKPMVIYLPLGTTFGNHKGDGLLEDFINDISNNKGIAIITGSGNEADTSGHTSGRIEKKVTFKIFNYIYQISKSFLD